MLHIVLLIITSLEEVVCEGRPWNNMFPGKQLSVNGSTSLASSRPALSFRHCAVLCLEDDDCLAANYENAGVCHMSAGGSISLEDSSQTTAILTPPKGNSFSTQYRGWTVNKPCLNFTNRPSTRFVQSCVIKRDMFKTYKL